MVKDGNVSKLYFTKLRIKTEVSNQVQVSSKWRIQCVFLGIK